MGRIWGGYGEVSEDLGLPETGQAPADTCAKGRSAGGGEKVSVTDNAIFSDWHGGCQQLIRGQVNQGTLFVPVRFR